jgi:alpha-glucosidase
MRHWLERYRSIFEEATLIRRLLRDQCISPLAVVLAFATSHAQSTANGNQSGIVAVSGLPNGIRIATNSGRVEEITALRDDVLRIRVDRSGTLPEDASWAVLEEPRHSQAAVQRSDSVDAVGFRTGLLQVSVGRADLRVSIRDGHGVPIQEDAAPITFDGPAFRLRKSMPSDEHYFGLGDKTGPLDRRNHAFTLWNTDAYRFQESTDPIYKSIPFFMTFRAGVAAGVLLDNTWRSSFDFGIETPTAYSFGAVDGPIDYYVFLGPTPQEVVTTYAWLTGKPPMPPRWMLGFQQSRYTYTPESRLLEVGERLRADHIPADALYLDIGFQDRNRPFSVDQQAFPDLKGTLSKLQAMNFHTVAITDLHIAKAPEQGYAPYDSGTAKDEFLHRSDGSVYVGSVWPGPSVFPDFSRPGARKWWGSLYKPLIDIGFAGFWNDMNEPSIFDSPTGTMPDDVVHRIEGSGFASRTATHAELHNVYGMENSRATYEGLLRLEPDVRPFVLTRATYAGGQRYAATWTGDNSSTWNHLRMASPMLKSLGLSGFSFSGADVGGFAGTAIPDLLTKWIEVASFQPIDRDHTETGTGDQEPWVGGPEHEAIRRRFIEERYRLMPYLYTLAEETARTGMPMMRPLFLDYPFATRDRHPIDNDPGVDAEFLLGHDLLIAPSPYPEAPDYYTVEFPSRVWYDYWTGIPVLPPPIAKRDPNAPVAAVDGVPLSAQIKPQLDALPVYVRGGAILPVAPLTQNTNEKPDGPLTVRVYVGEDCQGNLYDDDGKSFAYRSGSFLRMRFGCHVEGSRLTLTISPHEGTYAAWWRDLRIEVYGWNAALGTVMQNGVKIAQAQRQQNRLEFTVADDGKGATLTIE